MGDDFDAFLANALAPGERLPDRKFVSKVQLAVALEAELTESRRRLVRSFMGQLASIAAIAAGLVIFARAGPSASWIEENPAVGLAVLIALFVFAVCVLASRPDPLQDALPS